MTTQGIVIAIAVSIIASFIFSIIWIKFNTEIQNFVVDRSSGLYEKIKSQLAETNDKLTLFSFMQRIWYKNILTFMVDILSLITTLVGYEVSNNVQAYSFVPLGIAIAFTFVFFLKLNHVAKYYNLERILKKYLETEKGMKIFKSNIFWK